MTRPVGGWGFYKQEVWTIINSNLNETISLHPSMAQDLNYPLNDRLILSAWQLNLHPSISTTVNCKISPTQWEAPPTGCHKLNFDGASKGNPRPIGYGAVIRNNKGEILHITAGNLGHNTNNAAEVWGLLCGLQVATEQELFPIITEGDSQIVINLLSHFLNGVDPEKLSLRWRLMNGLLKIKSTLKPH
jgi:hypothetical protein